MLYGCLEVVAGWLGNFKVKEEEKRGLIGMDLLYYRLYFILGVGCVSFVLKSR